MFTFAVGHTYRLILYMSLFGQEVINRFDFTNTVVNTTPFSATVTLQGLWNALVPKIQDLVTDDLQFIKAQISHLGYESEGTWEFTPATPTYGNIAAATYPTAASFACLSWRLLTTQGISRSGWKRIGGIPQALIVNGLYDPTGVSGYVTATSAFDTQLLASFSPGGSNQFQISVVRNDGTPSAPAWIPHDVIAVSGPRLGTQNSRKINYGD